MAITPLRAYLAGPMTGYPEHNYPAFHAAADALRRLGLVVFNPAENFGGRTDLDRARYMRLDVELLLRADLLVVLPGWERSRGASLEVQLARELALPVVGVDGMPVEEPAPTQETVLEEAARITQGARQQDYGHPLDNHSRTAAFWSDYLGVEVSAEDVCWLNVLQKISRQMNAPKRDNVVDVCGWAENVERIQQERQRRQEVA